MEKLEKQFKEKMIKDIQTALKKKNIFEVPQIEKIVVSTGTGDFKEDKNTIEKIEKEIEKITGQKAKINLSRKAVSAFKLRIGQPVGLTTTLRGERMYDFLNRFINIALPRVRDFRGLKAASFDDQGNYSIGLKDYSIFPEIKYEDITVNFGLEVSIKTTAKNKEDARVLFEKLGFPFEKGDK
jgi:large subunit ribosomal protein L5